MIPIGIYRHYKGKNYRVIGAAKLEATLEDMVVYEPLYDSDVKLWIRPLSNFTENVTVNGQYQPRFAYLGPAA